MMMICYFVAALSTMSTTVCPLAVTSGLPSCFEVLGYLNNSLGNNGVDKFELTAVRDQYFQIHQAFDHLKEEITFKENYVKFDVDNAKAFT